MKIIEKAILAEAEGTRIIRLKVTAPEIASKAMPGQFVAVMACEEGERIPLTIVDKDHESITLIFQEVGFTTKLLGKLRTEESLYAIVGPLGHPTQISNYGRVILVGGGVGIAEIYPVAKAMKDAGNHITVILGSRTKGLLILEHELKSIADEFYLSTDDGSYGRKGFVTDVIQDLLDKNASILGYNLIYAVGPIPMMQRVSRISKLFNIKVIVSLNALMVDATGMCGCCRVSVGGQTKFSCVDGPDFEASLVDWDELAKRNRIYEAQEKHICNLKLR
jgi:ferredoxin--NADP+ reductase